ncbi:protein shisa-5-like [Anabas testudineus]|uniref:protein shisa-5-like n=1 Tax=Anabas testudineus TaxID=64144 RepID=UPI000E459505|nr:protein shisa-5-like [Anabas testudineus]
MAGIVSSVLSTLVILCLSLLPAESGLTYTCSSYWDHDDFYHDTQKCGSQYCCGDCNKRYCCSEKKYRLTQEQQDSCPVRPGNQSKFSSIAIILGAIFGCIVALIPCVALIICCVTPCCLIHKKCQERRNQRNQTVITTVIGAPLQPPTPSGHQPSHPGYQPEPVQPGFGDYPMPSAPPPSYQEATDPANFPAPFTRGHPMYPSQPPGQSYELLPLSHGFAQHPYNPAYDPQA